MSENLKTDSRTAGAPSALAGAHGSAAGEPLMPYGQWLALGPEKAAAYLSRRHGWSVEKQGRVWAILETFWDEKPKPSNEKRSNGGEHE